MEKINIKINLANAIQKSQYDLPTLAMQLGVSQKQLESYANGEKLPSIVLFANICKILNIHANIIIKSIH